MEWIIDFDPQRHGAVEIMHKLTDNRMKWGWSALLTGVLLLLGCSLWGGCRSLGSYLNRDCATRPPSEAFENVFGYSPPPGVSDLLAAGRIWPGGRDVYLRFRATDEAIRQLTKDSVRAVGVREIQLGIASTRMEDRLQGDPRQARWKAAVRWDEVERIQKPECYSVRPYSHSPRIILIVDPSHNLVYGYLYDI